MKKSPVGDFFMSAEQALATLGLRHRPNRAPQNLKNFVGDTWWCDVALE